MDKQIRQLEEIAARALAFEIAASLVAMAIFFGLLYLVIRAGVRDGMKDATQDQRPTRPRGTPAMGDAPGAKLPDMRVD